MKTKTLSSLIALLCSSLFCCAQAPQRLAYQTNVFSTSGLPLSHQSLNIRFTFIDSASNATIPYIESFSTTTNTDGHIVLNPGTGTPDSGSFKNLNWATGHKYMMVEDDLNSTGNYVYMGTAQLASVPYVFYTDSAAKSNYPKHYVGEYYGGGIVFYTSDNGQHGLIADSADLSFSNTDTVAWFSNSDTTMATSPSGITNTERITIKQGNGNYAAQICANYMGGSNGDWYLPSLSELQLLYQNKLVVGGFVASPYWSSNEANGTNAQAIDFSNGSVVSIQKSRAKNIRAIRSF